MIGSARTGGVFPSQKIEKVPPVIVAKACEPISSTDSGKTTEDNFEYANAAAPIDRKTLLLTKAMLDIPTSTSPLFEL